MSVSGVLFSNNYYRNYSINRMILILCMFSCIFVSMLILGALAILLATSTNTDTTAPSTNNNSDANPKTNPKNSTTTVAGNTNPKPSGIMFAPYLMPGNDVASRFMNVGGKYITLAFINWNGKPFWDSGDPDRNMLNQIRAKGGDVILSTGGESGNHQNTEPGLQGGNAQQIYQRYKSMVDMYNAKFLDLDIEVGKESQADSYQKRNDALVMLQKDYPNLRISYTLPCNPSGIGGSMGLIKDAATKGVTIDCVRVMSFDYGGGSGNYVNDTISCLTNTWKQCKNAELKFNGIGPIMMVPKDDNGRPMSINEVIQVVQWIKGAKTVITCNYIGFWELGQDPGLSYSKAIMSELG